MTHVKTLNVISNSSNTYSEKSWADYLFYDTSRYLYDHLPNKRETLFSSTLSTIVYSSLPKSFTDRLETSESRAFIKDILKIIPVIHSIYVGGNVGHSKYIYTEGNLYSQTSKALCKPLIIFPSNYYLRINEGYTTPLSNIICESFARPFITISEDMQNEIPHKAEEWNYSKYLYNNINFEYIINKIPEVLFKQAATILTVHFLNLYKFPKHHIGFLSKCVNKIFEDYINIYSLIKEGSVDVIKTYITATSWFVKEVSVDVIKTYITSTIGKISQNLVKSFYTEIYDTASSDSDNNRDSDFSIEYNKKNGICYIEQYKNNLEFCYPPYPYYNTWRRPEEEKNNHLPSPEKNYSKVSPIYKNKSTKYSNNSYEMCMKHEEKNTSEQNNTPIEQNVNFNQPAIKKSYQNKLKHAQPEPFSTLCYLSAQDTLEKCIFVSRKAHYLLKCEPFGKKNTIKCYPFDSLQDLIEEDTIFSDFFSSMVGNHPFKSEYHCS